MQAGQRDIYYLCAPSRELAESSPYYEAFKEKSSEVLFCFDPADEVTMLALNQFDRKSLTSVEKCLKEDKGDVDAEKGVEGGLSSSEIKDLMNWIKDCLGSKKVNEIKATRKLTSYPCLISVPDMSAARNFLRIQSFANKLTTDQRYVILRPTLEINPSHPIMKEIQSLRQTDNELAVQIMEQVYENAMVSAGLIDDVRPMVTRLNDLITKLMIKSADVKKTTS
ncbi:unnamed protein product [Soboliphyme baturini]|uniref:Heat shock protein 83 n=1 Tax=Soboliphyme baturini TaxID=241478 RepID=A0A183I9A2_9BILA|nr:unnamed protein product [Soboliphyme baturini]